MYQDIGIYIAGPECFYRNGFARLDTMRRLAEDYGFAVTLPNDRPLDLNHEDLRKNADAIFANCRESMNRSAAIIADLELFRGTEPDGGTVYEIGMAYALGLKCYAYTRDKRNMAYKYQNAVLRDGVVHDREGRVLPYQDLPFGPMIIGSCKVLEGTYEDCLKLLTLDLEEERKAKAKREIAAVDSSRGITLARSDKIRAYLAGPARYDADGRQRYAKMKELCARHHIEAITPLDEAPGVATVEAADPYVRAYNTFDRWQQHVRNCDLIIADLNDFHGWEPNSDTAFECGMAFQLGKKLYGYMNDTTIMKERIPNYGAAQKYKDIYDWDVENFNYPINLMFASSMKIGEGDFAAILPEVARDLQSDSQSRRS